MYTRHNHLENLDLHMEYDSAYGEIPEDTKLAEIVGQEKIVLCGETAVGVMENCSYILVDPHYDGELSLGQRELYEVLLALQNQAIYTITTIAKLTQGIGLTNPLACGKRLENLQSLGAIAGLNNAPQNKASSPEENP